MKFRNALFCLMIILVVSGYIESKEAKKERIDLQYALASSRDSLPIADTRKSVVTVRLPGGGHGSGFVVSENGLLLTNAHVVGNSDKCLIESRDGREFEGIVLNKDSKRDVAAIIARNISLPPLKIRSGFPKIAEEVYAIGAPHGLPGTVTKGIISNIIKSNGEIWLQGDSAINPGSSGGPLLDANGNVVGISTSVVSGTQGIFLYCPIMDAVARLELHAKKPVIWYKPSTWVRWFL